MNVHECWKRFTRIPLCKKVFSLISQSWSFIRKNMYGRLLVPICSPENYHSLKWIGLLKIWFLYLYLTLLLHGYTLRKKQRLFEILNVFEIDSLNHVVWNWWIYLTMCNILVLTYYVAIKIRWRTIRWHLCVNLGVYPNFGIYGPVWCSEISRTFRNHFEASYIKRFIILLYIFCFFCIISLPLQ